VAESTSDRLVGTLINSYRGKNVLFHVVLQSAVTFMNITTTLNEALLYLKRTTLEMMNAEFQILSKPFGVMTQLFVSPEINFLTN
jgi:hypothetical protein